MPSSHPGELIVEPASHQEHLLQVLTRVPDPSKLRGRRHPLAALIAVAVCAVLASAKGFTAIGQWAADTTTHTLTTLGMVRGLADEATFRRTFARLDADLLDQALGAWAATRLSVVEGLRVISLDGKTLRGARTGTERVPHLVAALCGTATLGQAGVDAKSNEISAVQDLLQFIDINGAVVTVEVMHTQTDTATTIGDRSAHYVFTVKANNRNLYTQLKTCPGSTCRTTRDTAAPPLVLAGWVRRRWGIENNLHHVRDVTYDEDRSQVRTGSVPQVMAALRNTAIGLLRAAGFDNIAEANRHMIRDEARPLRLLQT